MHLWACYRWQFCVFHIRRDVKIICTLKLSLSSLCCELVSYLRAAKEPSVLQNICSAGVSGSYLLWVLLCLFRPLLERWLYIYLNKGLSRVLCASASNKLFSEVIFCEGFIEKLNPRGKWQMYNNSVWWNILKIIDLRDPSGSARLICWSAELRPADVRTEASIINNTPEKQRSISMLGSWKRCFSSFRTCARCFGLESVAVLMRSLISADHPPEINASLGDESGIAAVIQACWMQQNLSSNNRKIKKTRLWGLSYSVN